MFHVEHFKIGRYLSIGMRRFPALKGSFDEGEDM